MLESRAATRVEPSPAALVCFSVFCVGQSHDQEVGKLPLSHRCQTLARAPNLAREAIQNHYICAANTKNPRILCWYFDESITAGWSLNDIIIT